MTTHGGNGKPSRDLIDEYCTRFPGSPEAIWSRFTAAEMRSAIDEAQSRIKLHESKSDAKGKPKSSRFHELSLFWARGTIEGDLELSEIAVWNRLWEVEGREGSGYASMSFNQLERETRTCRRTVERSMRTLQTKLMVKTVRKGNIKGDVSHYVISPYPSQEILDKKDAEYALNSHASGRTMRPGGRRMVSKTGAHEAPIPEGGDKSPLPGGRPTDVPYGTGSFGRPDRLNSDGGTNPLSPPSTSTQPSYLDIDDVWTEIGKPKVETPEVTAILAKARRAVVNGWINHYLDKFDGDMVQVEAKIRSEKHDFHMLKILDEELAKRREA